MAALFMMLVTSNFSLMLMVGGRRNHHRTRRGEEGRKYVKRGNNDRVWGDDKRHEGHRKSPLRSETATRYAKNSRHHNHDEDFGLSPMLPFGVYLPKYKVPTSCFVRLSSTSVGLDLPGSVSFYHDVGSGEKIESLLRFFLKQYDHGLKLTSYQVAKGTKAGSYNFLPSGLCIIMYHSEPPPATLPKFQYTSVVKSKLTEPVPADAPKADHNLRYLVHVSVPSLMSPPLPMDMAYYRTFTNLQDTLSYRLSHPPPDTTAFRLMNSDVTIDVYNTTLMVRVDEQSRSSLSGLVPQLSGLPNVTSIYGYTAPVDRSRLGSSPPVPTRLYPSASSDPLNITVFESGVPFQVTLGSQYSTGLFLDSRPLRAYLARTGPQTILNAFAHASGYSLSSLSNPSTVHCTNLDLSASWLARARPSYALANHSVPYDDAMDDIYGDVFSWLPRLAKKSRKFSCVILDPPSSSVGTKKKRWSTLKDYPSLVATAEPLVAPKGILITVSNYAKWSHADLAMACRAGFTSSFTLEHIVKHDEDFKGGKGAAKILIWRRL